MTEELETTKPNKAVAVFATENGFKVAQKMALAISASTLMPAAYQGEKGLPNVLIAMEIANRMGMSVFLVAQNLNVIYGKPSFGTSFLIATVNSSGKFSPLRFRWQGEEGTDSRGCRAVAKDLSTGDECVGSLITVAIAKAEGWYGRKDSKWPNLSEQMCAFRAAAFWQRLYCPEAGLGMQTTEELSDFEAAIPVQVVQRPTNAELEERLRAVPATAPVSTTVTSYAGKAETKVVETPPVSNVVETPNGTTTIDWSKAPKETRTEEVTS